MNTNQTTNVNIANYFIHFVSSCPLFAQEITPLEFKSADDLDHHIIKLHIPMNMYENVLEA
jgi:hypothetical protein